MTLDHRITAVLRIATRLEHRSRELVRRSGG